MQVAGTGGILYSFLHGWHSSCSRDTSSPSPCAHISSPSMLNLLIAMMGQTYSDVQDKSEQEFSLGQKMTYWVILPPRETLFYSGACCRPSNTQGSSFFLSLENGSKPYQCATPAQSGGMGAKHFHAPL